MTIPTHAIEKIVNFCKAKDYKLDANRGEVNIIYVEGMSVDGDLNADEPNQFNDLRLLLDSKLRLLGCWSATTEPGRWYTEKPMNSNGAARIAFGQFNAWRIGVHGNSEPHEALVQISPVAVYRDRNQDGKRTNDRLELGNFGINQHWGYDMPIDNIGKASAGCLVGRSRQGHREFMALVKTDSRYRSKDFTFSTIIIPGNEL